MVRCVCSGRQFLFSYKIEKRIFDHVSVDESEIFVNFCMKEDFRKLPQSFLLLEVGPPTKTAPPLSAALIIVFAFFFLFFFFFLSFLCRPLFRRKVGKFGVTIGFKFFDIVPALFDEII